MFDNLQSTKWITRINILRLPATRMNEEGFLHWSVSFELRTLGKLLKRHEKKDFVM